MTIPNTPPRHHHRPSSSLSFLGQGRTAPIPSVERTVSESTEIWARDLRSLFEHAKGRFGDVSWESDEGGERIWAHKAIIYARAPKAFKERYFLLRPFSRSPHSFASPSASPTPHLLPPFSNGRSESPGASSLISSGRAGTASNLSVSSLHSDNTIRGPGADGVLRLTHGDTPELFSAQLEWLYTGEGFGDVVEWIDEDNEAGGSIRDSLGRRGDIHDRRDKLGQDLTYMWRSKLYVDVRIHLKPQLSAYADEADLDADEDSDSSTDSLSSTTVFTAHRFILCSRSPYFASVLLNPSFKPQSTADIHLPTPPFTPAALHFCLGYMYAGHLDFSNRSFDLTTAFAIYRAAMYLQLEALVQEIEARIMHDFCHGLDIAKCRCRRCPLRAARVWRFASEPDIGAVQLRDQARKYVLRTWGQSWGREIGLLDKEDKDALVKDVCATITPETVIGTLRNIKSVRSRMDNGLRAKGRDAAVWVDSLGDMVDRVESHYRNLLADQVTQVADSTQLWELLSGKGFDGDVLDTFVNEVVASVGTAKGCVEGPRVYQALVSSILLKTDPITQGPVLLPRTQARNQIEVAREGVLAHVRRRWMQIRDAGGFQDLDHWVIKEISDEIDVSLEDLMGPSAISPFVRKRFAASAPSGGLPRTTSRAMSLSDAGSLRSSAASSSRLSIASSRPSTIRANATTDDTDNPDSGPSTTTRLEAPGLRRLRLSSSASTASVASTRSARSVSGPATAPIPGSASARSPTAAEKGKRVFLRTRENTSPTPSSARPTRQISGPPKPLMTRPTPGPASRERPVAPQTAVSSAASVRSVRSGRTTASRVNTSTPPLPKSPSKLPKATSPTTRAATVRSKGSTSTGETHEISNAADQSAKTADVTRTGPTPSTAIARTKSAPRGKSPTPSTVSTRSRLTSTASAASQHRPATTSVTPRSRFPSTASTAAPRGPTSASVAPPNRLPTTSASASQKAPPSAAPNARDRVPSTASTASSKLSPQNTAGTRNRIPSSASQTSTRQAVPPARPVPGTTTATRNAGVSSVRSRAAAINAQNTNVDKQTARNVGTVKPRTSEPAKSSPLVPAAVAARTRSPSVSSVVSKRSVAPKAPVTARLAVDHTEPVPARLRPASTATAQKQPASVRGVPSSSSLRGAVFDRTKPAISGLPPASLSTASATEGKSSARTETGKLGNGPPPPVPKRSAPETLAAPKRPPPAIPYSTQGLRSPSGSTEETSGAVTPRLDGNGLEPTIRREGSDISDLPGPPSPPKHTYPIPPSAGFRTARKVSQTSTLSTNSSFRPHPASAFDPPKREVQQQVLPPLEITDGSSPWEGPGVALQQGIGCIVSLDKKRARFRAMVKYIGLLKDTPGPWIGIETDNLDRFGVDTLPTGSLDGIHYFHLSRAPFTPDPNKLARQRKLDLIRQSLGKRASVFITGPTSLGLGVPHAQDRGGTGGAGGSKRSVSPYAIEHGSGGFDNPRALFVRPHEVVFVLGAE